MHVFHVLSTSGLGGMERVALDLAEATRERGDRASVVALADEGPMAAELRAAGIPLVSLPRRGRGYDLRVVMRLRRLLQEQRADLVHTHNPLAMLYGAVAGRAAGCAVVHTKHGINPGTPRQRAFRRQVARLVDSYVAVSAATAIVAVDKREVDATKLRVIPNGIDLRRYDAQEGARERIRAELGIPEDAFVAGTVGRLAREKDQATLLRATGALLGRDFHVVVAGDGPEAQPLRDAAAAMPNASSIHLLGARNDVPRLMAAMDAFVLTSITEGLPLVILEAMAAGLPIVSTGVGGIPEVVQEGVSGHLFAAGDEAALVAMLRRLAGDRAYARRLGDAGRVFARARYARDVAVERYYAVYRTAIDAHRPFETRP
jgi:glycosyltransferase involved in cell wall biosynthesis